MIASVRGEVLDIALDHVVIEAAGVGYKVMATPSTLATLRRGNEARLITAMIVREDSMTLYGFADADALALAICHCWRAPMIARMAAAEALAAAQQRKYKATIKAKAKAAR